MTNPENTMRSQHQVWENWAQFDPLWAILSDPDRRGNRWELDEFFKTGISEIDELQIELAERGFTYGTERALDFGCGVGRLTQALANVFDECDGVDISETMVELARGYNRHGDRCRYHVNVAADLSFLEDGSFDLIFTTLVLQHNPPEIALRYIREFVRLLKSGGIAVFDMPADPGGNSIRIPASSHRASIEFSGKLPVLHADTVSSVSIVVTNTSEYTWPPGHIVKVGNHWKSHSGELIRLDDGRRLLPGLPPGGQVKVDLPITSPPDPGRYSLEVDLVEEGVAWFADRNSPVLSASVVVVAAKTPWRARLRRRPATQNSRSNEPAAYSMNGLSKELVTEAVTNAGGEVAQTRPSVSAGDEWLAFRYFVTRD